ncbi:MAG: hypothetical protein JWO25_3800 [Alphaproteobacteria bacterium]|nr:hypothetical protein [Alphaproteobacteria bacterium]MDB5722863.1 hypothetical protein [Alphaproteobacteria bacterium]
MDPAWTPVLAWMFGLAVTFVFVPPLALLSFRWFQHTRRRKMVNAPRKIKVLGDEEGGAVHPCAGGHQRSKRNAKAGKDGAYVSVCKTCGVPMRRNGPGDWTVIE